jgi:hypothetical protein
MKITPIIKIQERSLSATEIKRTVLLYALAVAKKSVLKYFSTSWLLEGLRTSAEIKIIISIVKAKNASKMHI